MSKPLGRGVVGEDGSGTTRNAHVHERLGHPGLVTFQADLFTFSPRPIFFFNATNGIAMNVNAAFSGVPLIVCNGSESSPADWAFSQIVGTKASDENTDQKNSGSNSVHWNNGALNDIIEFDNGSDVAVGSYVGVSLFIYVDKDWSIDDEISMYAWDTGTSAVVGNAVDLGDFFDAQTFDVFQGMAVSFDQLGLLSGTFDAIRFEITAKSGPSPKIYLDDVQVEAASGAAEYRVNKNPAKDYHIKSVILSFVDVFAGTLSNASMPALAFDQILAVASLTNGILFKLVQNNKVTFTVNVKQLSDFLRAGNVITHTISDGTDTMLTVSIPFPDPIVLQGSPASNYLSLTVSDNLSVLTQMNAVARGSDLIS